MFDVFKKVLTGETIREEESTKVSQFLLLRWLSGDARLIPLANSLNTCQGDLPSQHTIILAIQEALKGKIKFIKYPSSKKSDGYQVRQIELLARYYEVGLQEARDYYDFCKARCPEELDEILRIFKVSGS